MQTTLAPTLTAHFEAFVQALEDPMRGAEIFDALTPDAVVMFNFQAVPVSMVGKEAFAQWIMASWTVFGEYHPGARRRPAVSAPRLVSLTGEGSQRVVAWWEATEAVDGQALVIATGYRDDGDGWRLEWLTLAESVADWSYAWGKAQAVADYPYAAANVDVVPRSWLDLAHFRLYGYERPQIETLPESRFTCGMRGTCCTIDYRIVAPGAAQAFIDAVPWEQVRPDLAGTQLPVMPDGQVLIKDNHEKCRFLDGEGYCSIHKAFGRPVFEPCTVFPFRFARTPDGVVAAASPLCGTVRSNLGQPLSERQEELHRRMAMLGSLHLKLPETYHLVRGTDVSWEAFKATEAAILAVLAREELPLRQRLWVALQTLNAAIEGMPLADPAWDTESFPEPNDDQRAVASFFLDQFADLAGISAPAGRPEGPSRELDARMAVTLRQMIFSKTYSQATSLRVALHVAIATALMAERLQAASAPGPVPDLQLSALAKSLYHGTLAQALLGTDKPQLAEMLDEPWLGVLLLAASA